MHESHGTNHSRGVIILFRPKLDVNIEQIISDKNGRYILVEALVEGEKFVFLNITTVFVDTRLWKTKHSRKRFQNFRQSYVLSTCRIEIHQSQPASMT